MRCVVTFKLRPGLTPEEYLEWFRRENVPAIRQMTSITSYHVWRVGEAMEGEPGFQFLEEMEITGRADFERELEEIPDVVAMLEGWYSRVTDQVVVYADEVAQD